MNYFDINIYILLQFVSFIRILSKNNSKRASGTVKIENGRDYAMIPIYMAGVYRVEITKEDLDSLNFCKSLAIEIRKFSFISETYNS